MSINVQMKILNTKNYYQYLKENSQWFKELNRDDKNIVKFTDFVKEKYSLKISDRISSALDGINTIQNVLSIIK